MLQKGTFFLLSRSCGTAGPICQGSGPAFLVGKGVPKLLPFLEMFCMPWAIAKKEEGGQRDRDAVLGWRDLRRLCHDRRHPLCLPHTRMLLLRVSTGAAQWGTTVGQRSGVQPSSSPQHTPLPSQQLPRAPPDAAPHAAFPISLLSQQTTPVAVTQINSNLLDLSGKQAALTCHKSLGRHEMCPAPTPSLPWPAAYLPCCPVSR